jgi:protoheme IX farnesyltransferase
MSIPTLALEQERLGLWSHLHALFELTKPKIALLELMTVLVAACVASSGIPNDWLLLFNALVGTALIAASASALNQWWERDVDFLMQRTANRPLPAGQLGEREAFWFGALAMVGGTLYLVCFVNFVTALLGVVTWVLYVCVYTPLKKRTSANTLVGAIAGAGPVLMGWAAVSPAWGTREDTLLAATLFGIVFFWQFPHFMAIAWIYREDYARAGSKMLTVTEPSGRLAGLQAVASSAILVPLSLLPAVMMKTGPVYFLIALVLCLTQLVVAAGFLLRPSDCSARRLLRMSLIFLPLLFGLLWLSPFVFPWL